MHVQRHIPCKCSSSPGVRELCAVHAVLSFACRHGWAFGQYSDDTQQSREMYLTVLQGRGRMDAQLYALRTALLFQPGAYRVMG